MTEPPTVPCSFTPCVPNADTPQPNLQKQRMGSFFYHRGHGGTENAASVPLGTLAKRVVKHACYAPVVACDEVAFVSRRMISPMDFLGGSFFFASM